MGLDLRLLGPTSPGSYVTDSSSSSTWGTGRPNSHLWPVRAGSLGRKNKECGFNAQGPWLASLARADPKEENPNGSELGLATAETSSAMDDKNVFVVVVAEPDAGVTAENDALGGGDAAPACAWRLVAHPPLSIQTALPCDCEYEVIESRPDGDTVAARGVVRAGVREPVLGVDPTSPLRLRLEPLDAPMGDRESTGRRSRVPFAFARCRGTVPVNDPVPGGRRTTDRSPAVHELLVSPSDTLSDTSSGDNLIRLAVTCEPACATHGSLSGPAPPGDRNTHTGPAPGARSRGVPLPAASTATVTFERFTAAIAGTIVTRTAGVADAAVTPGGAHTDAAATISTTPSAVATAARAAPRRGSTSTRVGALPCPARATYTVLRRSSSPALFFPSRFPPRGSVGAAGSVAVRRERSIGSVGAREPAAGGRRRTRFHANAPGARLCRRRRF